MNKPEISHRESLDGGPRCLRILLVSTADLSGGAEISAWHLFNAYRRQGHNCRLAVGNKRSNDPDVVSIPKDSCRNAWARLWIDAQKKLVSLAADRRGVTRLQNLLRLIGEPHRWLERKRGYEDFDFPASWRLLQLAQSPDIVHCFNLHGGYFDLRVLPWLSRQQPVILDLRDAWLLSGHCAHSFGCERWKTGCGECPDLTIYPAIARDGTATNWRRKREIYSQSQVYVCTPCQWLMRKVEKSMLAPAIIESRVIPTGVDINVFHPADKSAMRSALNLPQEAKILLFAANGIRRNIWKDYNTLQAAVIQIAERLREAKIHLIALGEEGSTERVDAAVVHFVAHQKNPEDVARYYQAADVYVHAARVDTFPRTVLEALACAVPVVASQVGGIAEQIKGWQGLNCYSELNCHSVDDATGVLVPIGAPEAIAESVQRLLTDETLRWRISKNAATDARERFNLERQAARYLDWYEELTDKNAARPSRITSAL
jgi:glycosyltransferase involved in cell wall biosynthesis